MRRKFGWTAVGIVGMVFAPIGLVFLVVDEQRARWTVFAFYVVMLLLSMYGFVWFCNSYE